ncbi:MAG: hypothetical protein KDK25_14125 [Leptospiraceae bacterium]|nr:hypothetical protein [Leptospiraceae bacterium]
MKGTWTPLDLSALVTPSNEHQEPVDPAVLEFQKGLPKGAAIEGSKILHQCDRPFSVAYLAREYYSYSALFSRGEIEEAMIRENPQAFKGEHCRPGSTVAIPEPLIEPIRNQPLGWEKERPVRAIYLRGDNTTPRRLLRELKHIKDSGANAIVFDVKDILGVINYSSNVAEVEEYRRHAPPIRDLSKIIRFLHDNNIYVIARMALFQDQNLSEVRPDLAIKDRNSPDGVLKVKGRNLWVDPGRDEVQAYNLKIFQELLIKGVDEVQFDYVRYPAEGDLSGVHFHNVKDVHDKTQNLKRFLAAAFTLSRGTGVHIAIDVFGIVAWGEEVDIRTTGQRLNELSVFVDIMSPMLYPSHFSRGYAGFENPADEPYHFYKEGVERVRQLSPPGTVVRPWLQAFAWRVTNYNEDYIIQQIRGNHSGGGTGWMMWNAGNSYDMVYRAIRNSPNLVHSEQVEEEKPPSL